jgi:uncharacterized protein (DUF2267 family)
MSTKKIKDVYEALKKELGTDRFREILTNLGLEMTEDGKRLYFVEGRETVGTKVRYNISQFIEDIQKDHQSAHENQQLEYAQMLEPALQIIKTRMND